MPRPRSLVPSYRLHRGTGQAVVTLTSPTGSRRDVYLGPFGTEASIIEFGRVLIEWKTGATATATPGRVSVAELILAFWKHALGYYGEDSQEVHSLRYAFKPLRELFGPIPVDQFGPKCLKALRERYIEIGWSRLQVNRQINRVRRLFKWGVAEEMVPAAILHGMQAVGGLPRGRSAARETAPIKPVADADVQAVLPYLTATVQAMVMFQRHCGCRPGEVVQLRPIDLDRSDPAGVWWYRPQTHKTAWAGKERLIAVGPKAQAALAPLLILNPPPDRPLFSPQQATAERQAAKRAVRRSPVQPSQICRKKAKPRKQPGDQYDTLSYGKAVKYGIARAEAVGVTVQHWHVNQLRHTRTTELRKAYGIESASSVLGHSELRVTEIYAEKDRDLARRVSAETG